MLSILAYLTCLTSWPTIILIIIVALHYYSTRNYNYWKSLGVKGPKPLPLIGNVGQLFSKARCLQMVDDYKKFGKIYGIYEGSEPKLVIAIPELIRDVYIKDFDKFVDRGLPTFNNPLLDRSLLVAQGDQWKQSRVILSPTFSSTNLKKMHKLIEECNQRLDTTLAKIADSQENEIKVSQLMANYTMDVISYCGFATKIDAYNTGAELHPFIKNSKEFFKPSLRYAVFFLMTTVVPWLLPKTNLTVVSSDAINYLQTTIKTIQTERELQRDGKFVDFLQLLNDSKNKKENKDIDDDIKREVEIITKTMDKKGFILEDIDIMATSVLFILAGSETTSSALSHLFHELALNPECQQRLYEEIISCGENIDYQTINRLPYLNACVNETLRKYPGQVFTQRIASEDYILGDTGLLIPKGMQIIVPVYAMHHDPMYFPDPGQFNPDRFMPENRLQLIPHTFLPFGTGPRNCLGMRFALTNIKTAVVKTLAKYRFCRTTNTKTEFQYKKFIVFVQALDMGSIRLERRN